MVDENYQPAFVWIIYIMHRGNKLRELEKSIKTSKKHFDILINGKKVKILGCIEKPYVAGIYHEENHDALFLRTKIKGQMFYTDIGAENSIEIQKDGVSVKYICAWHGCLISGLLEQHIYYILDKITL